jgi:hypothetical protein
MSYPKLSTLVLFGECLSKAQPYRVQKQGSLCASCFPEPCPRTALSQTCFNRRALGIRPRSPLWLARVTGYPMPNHRRTALGSPKAKTPARCSVVLALGRAAAKRLEQQANASLATLQDHTATCGGLTCCSIRLVATPDAAIIYRFVRLCNVD